MADEGKPEELLMPHVEAPGFRTIFANGALFTSPSDASRNWQLTFYSDGARVVSETLIAAEVEGSWRHSDPPKIETQRVRRDEVCVIISEAQLLGLIKVLSTAMQGEQQ